MYDYGYTYDYTTSYNDTSAVGGFLAIMGTYSVIISIFGILMIVCMWKIFSKAGKPGWASIVPIYNFIVLLEIVELPMWYIALFFIPFANIYAVFKIYIELAHKFGKSTGFGVASVFFSIICFPILAFSNCTYNGKVTENNSATENVGPVVDNNQTSNDTTNTVNNEESTIANDNVSVESNTVDNTDSINQLDDIQPIFEENTAPVEQNVSTKKCPHCGKDLPMDATFCDGCNQQI